MLYLRDNSAAAYPLRITGFVALSIVLRPLGNGSSAGLFVCCQTPSGQTPPWQPIVVRPGPRPVRTAALRPPWHLLARIPPPELWPTRTSKPRSPAPLVEWKDARNSCPALGSRNPPARRAGLTRADLIELSSAHTGKVAPL